MAYKCCKDSKTVWNPGYLPYCHHNYLQFIDPFCDNSYLTMTIFKILIDILYIHFDLPKQSWKHWPYWLFQTFQSGRCLIWQWVSKFLIFSFFKCWEKVTPWKWSMISFAHLVQISHNVLQPIESNLGSCTGHIFSSILYPY